MARVAAVDQTPLSAEEVRRLVASAVDSLNDPEPVEGLHPGWRALVELRTRGGRAALDLCAELCAQGSPDERSVASAVLGQLTCAGCEEERFAALAALLARESREAGDELVLADVCLALGHLQDARVIPIALPLIDHVSEDVRYGVVQMLSMQQDAAAIAGLIRLSADPCDAVRDWATFALGSLNESHAPMVRDALAARLQDADAETRHEAIVGLALRKDPRALPALIDALSAGELSRPLLEAATEVADPALCEALVAARAHGLVYDVAGMRFDLAPQWGEAAAACGCDAL